MIDDERHVREVIGLLLRSLGHDVTESSSGHDALARLATGLSVELVITDLVMPGMDGWEVAARVKARWPSVRVGVISGNYGALAEHPHRDVDFVISKPAGRDTLERVLASLENRRRQGD